MAPRPPNVRSVSAKPRRCSVTRAVPEGPRHGPESPGRQHRERQSLVGPARGPKRMREPSALQRALHAVRHGAHVGAAPRRPRPDHHDTVRASHEAYELALGAALPATETRTSRRMLHVPGVGDSASPAGASAAGGLSGAGWLRAVSHSSAAA